MWEGNDIRFFMCRGHYIRFFGVGEPLDKEFLCEVATILDFYMGEAILQRIFMLEGNDIRFCYVERPF